MRVAGTVRPSTHVRPTSLKARGADRHGLGMGWCCGRADNRCMHLVLPFASGASRLGAQALHSLQLPRLESLLAQLQPGSAIGTDACTLNLPHEQVLARCRGWPCDDGRLPFAAALARADGIPVDAGDDGWGLLTPTHWQVGREQVVLRDPDELALDEAQSRALLQAVLPLFHSEGWALHWGAPLRWYACHASLRGLRTASLDRVIGRAIDPWLPQRQAARQVRRLQSEVQMLLHTHALNDAREARGALPVNSFWLSGTGVAPGAADAAAEPDVDLRLRTPLLAEDWAGWAEAWHGLDAQRLAELQARLQRGEAVSLTLCGERRAQRFDGAPRNGWARLSARWRRVAALPVLQAL
jgi:hypothetical protein